MEWALFNQILIIGIIVGLVVFGLLFYAIIRFREKPHELVEVMVSKTHAIEILSVLLLPLSLATLG